MDRLSTSIFLDFPGDSGAGLFVYLETKGQAHALLSFLICKIETKKRSLAPGMRRQEGVIIDYLAISALIF